MDGRKERTSKKKHCAVVKASLNERGTIPKKEPYKTEKSNTNNIEKEKEKKTSFPNENGLK